jgi:L-ascorbate metabolism protein UlaG (beta-lactamase superfamily)
MGCGVGFVIRLPGEPSLYLSGDTVLTPAVTATLEQEKPSVSVVHAGGAQLDIGKPILMPLAEVRRFAELAPKDVVAIHLEALNHCQATRAQIRELAKGPRIGTRLHVPNDGEALEFRSGSSTDPA